MGDDGREKLPALSTTLQLFLNADTYVLKKYSSSQNYAHVHALFFCGLLFVDSYPYLFGGHIYIYMYIISTKLSETKTL